MALAGPNYLTKRPRAACTWAGVVMYICTRWVAAILRRPGILPVLLSHIPAITSIAA